MIFFFIWSLGFHFPPKWWWIGVRRFGARDKLFEKFIVFK